MNKSVPWGGCFPGSQGHRHRMGQNPTVSQQQSQQSKRGGTHILEGEPKSPVEWGRRSSSSGAQRMGGGDANQGGGGGHYGPCGLARTFSDLPPLAFSHYLVRISALGEVSWAGGMGGGELYSDTLEWQPPRGVA